MRSSSMMHAVAVQPMPSRPRPVSGAVRTSMLAASMAAPSWAESAVAGASLAMVWMAMELATSPAAWPPMPSETAKSGGRQR